MALHQQLFAIVHQVDGSEVSIIVGHLLQLTLPVDGIEVLCSMPYANEIDHRVFVVAPYEIIDIGVETFCDVFLLTSS